MSVESLSTEWIKVSEPFPHVFLVELNRGPVNAFSTDFVRQFGTVFDRLGGLGSEDANPPDVRAVVISSAIPKLFTAGLDLMDAASLADLSKTHADPARSSLALQARLFRFQQTMGKPEKCAFPVIAAVHGSVIGLGVDLISACDIRYAADNSSFAIKEIDIGLAADIGTLAYLPKITGNMSLVRELAYTARPFDAYEAEKLGLISKVVKGSKDDVVREALELARIIAGKSPVAVAGSKNVLTHARDHTVQENLDYVTVWNAANLMTLDIPETLRSTKLKKPAKFLGLRATSKL